MDSIRQDGWTAADSRAADPALVVAVRRRGGVPAVPDLTWESHMKFLQLGNAMLALSLLAVTPGVHAQDKAGSDAHRTVSDGSRHTADDMTQLYYDDAHTKDCGTGSKGEKLPAFLCSGIIIRAAVSGSGFYSWNIPQKDVDEDGVSYSYLRKDSKFNGLVKKEGSGYTLYPFMGKYKYPGSGKEHVIVVCAFPLDGWTDERGKPSGCGEPTNQPDGGKAGRLCQDQHITTASAWYDHYKASTYQNAKLYQCGFDVRPGTKDAAEAFMQMIDAMKLLGSTSFYEHNELRVQAKHTDWGGKKLPIQSFFYIGEDKGPQWAAARADQKSYYDQFKEFVPVIKINPPSNPSEEFKFHFYDDDQVVTPPSGS